MSLSAPDLVVAVTTRALFNLEFENEIFETEGLGLPAFRAYQREHEADPIAPGTAYPLVRDILALNERSPNGPVVEVVLLSRNDPDAAMRVFRSIEELQLPITRGAFRGGRDPWPFVETFGCHLFLSADPGDVVGALSRGTPAALVSSPPGQPLAGDTEVRIAFDADSVLFDGESDRLWEEDAAAYFRHEREFAEEPLNPGPFAPFLRALAATQKRFPEDASPIRTAVVTARTAPAHMRVVNTFRAWDVRVDEVVLLGATPKVEALKHFRPHLFVDDRRDHVERAASTVASAQVLPLGAVSQLQLFEAKAAEAPQSPARRRSRRRAGAGRRLPDPATLLSTYESRLPPVRESEPREGDPAPRPEPTADESGADPAKRDASAQ